MEGQIVTLTGLVDSRMLPVVEQCKSLLKEADNLVNIVEDNGLDTVPFRQYRKQLRDIPQTYNNPEDVVWPQKPSLPQASA
ncbi:Phage tail protein [Vibrio crassostreae]|nr:Phage tail protein [Vibrio crassostreae]CAK3437076.1 Phage tail protein [Vibrio crassostreae]CAK3943246.1 Phage tail protein [Vibrio crassostreae]